MTDSPQSISVVSSQIETIREDLTNLAQVCQSLLTQMHTIQSELRDYIDHKDDKNRGRFISMLSVFVPVVLGLGGVLWAVIAANTSMINDIRKELAAARIEAASKQGRYEAQLEFLLKNHREEE